MTSGRSERLAAIAVIGWSGLATTLGGCGRVPSGAASTDASADHVVVDDGRATVANDASLLDAAMDNCEDTDTACPVDAGSPDAAGPCIPGGWCPANPPPPGLTPVLWSVWGSSASDVWAVGYGGILHWDGSAWSAAATGTTLLGVWGTGPSDVWAVPDWWSKGSILHWDGSTWSPSPGGVGDNLSGGIWGSAPDDVWAMGGPIVHWGGSAWSPSTAPDGACMFPGCVADLRGVWGSGPSDVWAVGDMGGATPFTAHWNGSAWSSVGVGGNGGLRGVWGASPRDVWAVGEEIVHWDGNTWSAVWPSGGAQAISLSGIWGSGPSDVWAVGSEGRNDVVFHWDGISWSATPSSTSYGLAAVWGSGPNDVWAVGQQGVLHRQ